MQVFSDKQFLLQTKLMLVQLVSYIIITWDHYS